MEAMYTELQLPEDEFPDGTTPPAPKRESRRKNQAHFDLSSALYQMVGVDLTQIKGIDALTAQTILSEVGMDMSKWPTEKHFASWLGLCPNNQITGGKVKRRRTKKTDNSAAAALRVAAQSLARSNSAIGAFYRRMKARSGKKMANVATAHKLSRIVYYMLKNRVDFVDFGADHYDAQQRERAIKRLHKQASRLGMKVESLMACTT
jgi:transposase